MSARAARSLSPQPEPPDQPAGTAVAPPGAGTAALGPQPEPPDEPAARAGSSTISKFTLIRVAPFSGINPFDPQSLRQEITGASTPNSCIPGPLVPISTLVDIIPPNSAQIDIDPTSKVLSVRKSIIPTADTALATSYLNLNSTHFSTGPVGWQAISPLLPQNYPDGTQAFVVKRIDSGDFYRLTVTFQAAGILTIYSVSGQCCGQGGCP
jgi:hypothetical protein